MLSNILLTITLEKFRKKMTKLVLVHFYIAVSKIFKYPSMLHYMFFFLHMYNCFLSEFDPPPLSPNWHGRYLNLSLTSWFWPKCGSDSYPILFYFTTMSTQLISFNYIWRQTGEWRHILFSMISQIPETPPLLSLFLGYNKKHCPLAHPA